MSNLSQLQETIEQRIEAFDPGLELVALEQAGGGTLRIFIDREGGVDLGACERVAKELRDLNESYSLEVSSPGIDRPLTKPEHFRRFRGRRIKVRTEEAIEGRRNFTGTLTEADDEAVSVDTDGTAIRIPIARIRRSNLVPDLDFGQ